MMIYRAYRPNFKLKTLFSYMQIKIKVITHVQAINYKKKSKMILWLKTREKNWM